MRILLINTAGSQGSIAVSDTNLFSPVVGTEVMPGKTSSELLVPAVRRLMQKCGWIPQDLDAVVVVHGPGTFTGIRVGVSAAKGLSEAAGVPLIAVSRLELLAAAAETRNGRVYAVLDAGRGEFYLGEYLNGECLRERLMGNQDVLATIADGTVVVCETTVEKALAAFGPKFVPEQAADAVLSVALPRIKAKEFNDVALLDANYLRRTDLEIFAKPAIKKDDQPAFSDS
jgi:tRNA threonylcarbamoyladenosine biosynthesis protein TsaB